MAELGYPTASITTWYGLFGPANMPPELADKISRTVNAAARVGVARDRITASGVDPNLTSPAEFANSLRKERDQLNTVTKLIGFKKEN